MTKIWHPMIACVHKPKGGTCVHSCGLVNNNPKYVALCVCVCVCVGVGVCVCVCVGGWVGVCLCV